MDRETHVIENRASCEYCLLKHMRGMSSGFETFSCAFGMIWIVADLSLSLSFSLMCKRLWISVNEVNQHTK